MVVSPHCCGLFEQSDYNAIKAIPLEKCHVSGLVQNSVAQVTLEQTFFNAESHAIEAIYLFPIHPAAAVNNYEVAFSNGRKYIGVIMNKGEAKEKYEMALKSGQSAFLLESSEHNGEIFQSSVGNLQPGERVTVTIGYVTLLDTHDEPDSLRFVVPTTIAPRYRPANSDNQGEDTTDFETSTDELEYTVSAPYKVSIDLNFVFNKPVKTVQSPSHSIATKLNEQRTEVNVSFVSGTELLDSDIVVVLTGQDFDDPTLLVERKPGDAKAQRAKNTEDDESLCAMLSFVPRFDFVCQKCELLFVIDTSGSMDGFKMEQAKAALNLLLRSIPVDSYFNVFDFNYNFRSSFPSAVRYSRQSLKEAITFVDRLMARGGTELYPVLATIFSSQLLPEHKRQVIVLTDGEVSNVHEIVSLVAQASSTRLFTIGVGNSVSHELVNGVAKAGNGTAIYIMEGESFSEKVIQQLERAVQPAFTNLSVEWFPSVSNLQSEASVASAQSFFTKSAVSNKQRTQNPADLIKRAPRTSSPIFNGKRFIAFAIGAQNIFNCQKAVITGKDASGQSFRLEVSTTGSVAGSLLHTAAARLMIGELTEEQLYSVDHTNIAADDLKEAIESLSLMYNIVSNRTAFVCIEKRELPAWQRLSVPQRRNVPMLSDRHGGKNPRVSTHTSAVSQKASYFSGDYDVPDGACFPEYVSCDSDDIVTDGATIDKLQKLLRWQEFDGSFGLDNDFCEFAVGQTQKHVELVTDKFLDSEDAVNDAWKALAAHKHDQSGQMLIATLVALGFLSTVLLKRKTEWNMIAEKAVSFLAKQLKHLPRTQYEKLACGLMPLLR